MPWPSMLLSALLQAPQPSVPAPARFDCSAPEYRQFDFWIGEWDVTPNPETRKGVGGAVAGRRPASNLIQRLHGGCVISENWDDRQGGTGQSVNIYDRVSQQWHQTWVGSDGGLHHYWGVFRDGRMVLVGSVPLGPAAGVQGRRTVRLSFIPLGPDRVRQLSESLNTDGSWSINFDLIYTRRAPSK